VRTVVLWFALGSMLRGDSLVEQVYERLVRASGDRRTPPALVVQTEAARRRGTPGVQVAWFDPGKRIIGIDQKTLWLCAALKQHEADCIAVFLGHELAHFYRDHGWATDFSSRFAGLAVASNIADQRGSAEQRVLAEAQADELGGMIGYVAGFDTFGVAPAALAAAYREYSVPVNSPGYPSLPDRQAMAARAASNVGRLLPAFDAANILAALGYYLPAAQCYDFIANTFPSREILSNAGVAYALAAVEYSPERDTAMAYPWSLDGDTRMRPRVTGGTRGGDAAPEHRQDFERLMRMAREHLENASQRDADYAPALVNLACVEDLSGRFNAAVDSATRAIELLDRSRSTSVELVYAARAIAYLHLHQTENARADLSRVGDDHLRIFWQSVAEDSNSVPRTGDLIRRPSPGNMASETIGHVRAGAALQAAQTLTIPASPGTGPKITIQSSIVSGVRVLSVTWDRVRLNTMRTSLHYPGETAKGIRVGAALADVRGAYGPAAFRSRLLPDTWLVYDRERIVFFTDPNERVSGWLIFEVMQSA
jgi:tetratricopeptide (TPR) repeat protein